MAYATEAERLAARRESNRRYYHNHPEICKLKQLRCRTTDVARSRALEAYHRRQDAKAEAAGVPRRPAGRPRLTDKQVREKMAAYQAAVNDKRANGNIQPSIRNM